MSGYMLAWGIYLHMEIKGINDRCPHEQVTLLQAMDEACSGIRQWCLDNENIYCDLDEKLSPNPQDMAVINMKYDDQFFWFPI